MICAKPRLADSGDTSAGPALDTLVCSDMILHFLESDLDAVIRDPDARIDDLAFREPVGGALKLRDESGIVGLVELIHALEAREIVAHLVRILAFALHEKLGVG